MILNGFKNHEAGKLSQILIMVRDNLNIFFLIYKSLCLGFTYETDSSLIKFLILDPIFDACR